MPVTGTKRVLGQTWLISWRFDTLSRWTWLRSLGIFFLSVLGSAFYIEKHDENSQRSFENLCVVTHAASRVSWIFEMTRTSTLVKAEELCSGLVLFILYWSPLLSSSLHGQRDKLCFSQETPISPVFRSGPSSLALQCLTQKRPHLGSRPATAYGGSISWVLGTWHLSMNQVDKEPVLKELTL